MNLPRRAALAHSIAASLLFCVANAGAQEFPSQPIRIVVPYAAGGMTDIVARVIGQKLGEHLGQPVVIDNRPGAATIVGAEVVAGANRTAIRCWQPPIPRSPSTHGCIQSSATTRARASRQSRW